jgi:hypothetical protein
MKKLLLCATLIAGCGGSSSQPNQVNECFLLDGSILSSFEWEDYQGHWISNENLACQEGYPCAPDGFLGKSSAATCEPVE